MKRLAKVALWIWSSLLLLSGVLTWLQTFGTVTGSEFGMQIMILNKLGMLMVWFALFTAWRTLEDAETIGNKIPVSDSNSN